MLRPFQQVLEIPYKKKKQMFGVIKILQIMKKYQALNNNLIKMGILLNFQMKMFVKPEEEQQIQDATPMPL